jgi:hypothetical protein
MLRMVLLGLLIPLGLGVLSAMELRSPSRGAVAFVQPRAEPRAAISDSHEARLTKADRLEGASVSSEISQQAVLVNEGIASPEDIKIGSSEPPGPIARHGHNSRLRKVKVTTAARPKSEPKAVVIKRAAIPQLSNASSDAEPCRLKAFGGLRKALNSADCEI